MRVQNPWEPSGGGSAGEELSAFYSEDENRVVQPGEIMVTHGNLTGAMNIRMIRFAVISETDVFGKEKKKKQRKSLYEGQDRKLYGSVRGRLCGA